MPPPTIGAFFSHSSGSSLWLGINRRSFPILPQSLALGNPFAPSEAVMFPITPPQFRICGNFPLSRGFFHLLRTFLHLLSILRPRYPQKSFESIRGGNSAGGGARISPAGWGARSLRKMRVVRNVYAMFAPENSPKNRPQTAEAVKPPFLQEATPEKFKFRPKSPKMGADWRKSELPPNFGGHWEGVK